MEIGAFYYGLALPYFILSEFFFGKTLGKALFQLRVVGYHGKLSLAEAIVRNVLRLVDDTWMAFIGAVLILITKKNQRLGDIVAGTLVVEKLPLQQRQE